MSDQQLQEELSQVVAEYRRLERQIQLRTGQLAILAADNAPAGQMPTDFAGVSNRRYSIDFMFEPGNFEPKEQGVTIESGTLFRASYVECFVRGVGTTENRFDPTEELQISATLPWDHALGLFDFMWKLRDTGMDREWCDRLQPSLFLGGGYTGPLWFPRRLPLSGGTTVFAEVLPIISVITPDATFGNTYFESIQRYNLQISLVGHEVPDRSPL